MDAVGRADRAVVGGGSGSASARPKGKHEPSELTRVDDDEGGPGREGAGRRHLGLNGRRPARVRGSPESRAAAAWPARLDWIALALSVELRD